MDRKTPIFVAVDLETTGLDSTRDEIIEVGLVRFDGRGNILAKYNSLVYFAGELSPTITALTGINTQDLHEAPVWQVVKNQLCSLVQEDDVIVGHNVNFDLSFLAQHELNWFGRKIIDSWYLSTILLGNVNSYSLEYLMKIIGREYNAHRALDDALAVVDLLQFWQGELAKVSDKVLTKITEIAQEVDLPERILYESEITSRQLLGVKITTNCNRQRKVSLVVDYPKQSEKSEGLFYHSYSSFWPGVLNEKNDWKILAVSPEVWKTYLQYKDWWNDQWWRLDDRSEYLCKNFWVDFFPKSNQSLVEARVKIKILLKIDQGYWDGYLGEIVWFNEEKKIAQSLGCANKEGGHDCYYDRLMSRIVAEKRSVIMPWSAVENIERKWTNQLSIYFEQVLLEDGLSMISSHKIDRDGWQKMVDEIKQYTKEKHWPKKKNIQLTSLMKQIDLLWMGLQLMVRGQGREYAGKMILDFSLAAMESMAFLDLKKRWQNICREYQEIITLLEKNSYLRIIEMLERLFGQGSDDWLNTIILYEGGYFIWEMKRKKFSSWLNNCLKEYKTVNLIGGYPLTKDNYVWNLLENGSDSLDRNIVLDSSAENNDWQNIERLGWEQLLQLFRNKNKVSILCIFNSVDDLKSAGEMITTEGLGSQVYELGTKRGGRYFEVQRGKYQGIVLSNWMNLPFLQLHGVKFDYVYLDRLPFDSPNRFEVAMRSKEWQNDYFQEYLLPRMYQKLYYALSMKKNNGKFYLGDDRWWTKNYNNKLTSWK